MALEQRCSVLCNGTCLSAGSWWSMSVREEEEHLWSETSQAGEEEGFKLGKVGEGESYRDYPASKTRLKWG